MSDYDHSDRYLDYIEDGCRCAYDDESDEIVECSYCREERAEDERAEAEHQAKEERLRATGWYTEITTISSFMNRINWLAGTDYIDARAKVFGELLTTLAGYEPFLVAHHKFCKVTADKMAECRADARISEMLKEPLDKLDAVLARVAAKRWAEAVEAPLSNDADGLRAQQAACATLWDEVEAADMGAGYQFWQICKMDQLKERLAAIKEKLATV